MNSKKTRNKLILAAAVSGLVLGTGGLVQDANAGEKEATKKADGSRCGDKMKKKAGEGKCAAGKCAEGMCAGSKSKKKSGDHKCGDGSCGDKKKK